MEKIAVGDGLENMFNLTKTVTVMVFHVHALCQWTLALTHRSSHSLASPAPIPTPSFPLTPTVSYPNPPTQRATTFLIILLFILSL